MGSNDNMTRYVEMPVLKAILENTLPAMAAMVMVLIYNLADTFFIGQTNDPYQVAAISICMPIFMLCVTFGTIFGIGGTSLISRVLGEGNPQKAARICSFCFYGCVASGLLLTLIIVCFSDGVLRMMGASDLSYKYARSYLLIVATCCPFSVIGNSYNNILRSEGRSKEAMGGQLIGNLINVVLDPIFISILKMGIVGAAVATVIGNLVAAGYYIRYFAAGKSSLSIRLRDFTVRDGVASGVFAVGIPAALGSFLMSTSQVIANRMMAQYGDLAVAGFGVAGKINMIAGTFCVGFGQGIQPLLGFCVGSKNKKRFRELVSASLMISFGLGLALTILVLLFRKPIVLAFLKEPETAGYATTFTAILVSTGVLFGLFYVLVSILQAMGKGLASLIVNISRQGLVFIPALFVLRAITGVNGIVWAQPVADILAVLLAALCCLLAVRKFMREEQAPSL